MRVWPVLVFGGALCLSAQPPAQVYRDAFRGWNEGSARLEASATEVSRLPERASRAAEAAGKYTDARLAYLRELAEETSELLTWLRNSGAAVELDLAPAAELQTFVTTSTSVAARQIATYAGDPDRGIQQLRLELEKERAALNALGTAISGRQKAQEAAGKTLPATEAARAAALEQYQALANGLNASVAQAEQEATAWARYYGTLADAAKAAVAAGAVAAAKSPESLARPAAGSPPGSPREAGDAPAPVTIAGVKIMNPARGGAVGDRGAPPALETAPAAAPTARSDPSSTMPPLPLGRYVGEWTFPSGGLFHGVQPEAVDLVVREANRVVSGTLSARFILPRGSPDEPLLRFDFSGPLTAARIQRFVLETADGAKGVVDLIPGGAFNLLEINFQTETKPGKIRLGNFVLIKK